LIAENVVSKIVEHKNSQNPAYFEHVQNVPEIGEKSQFFQSMFSVTIKTQRFFLIVPTAG